MSKAENYTPNYEALYPGINQIPEVLKVLKQSDRKMKYFECDLKQERKSKDATGTFVKLPSREDSIERLQESAVQFASDESIHDQLEKKLLIEALMECLQKLPRQQRDLIVGYYFDRKTQQDLAKQFGITQQWVGELIQKGIEKLGIMLKSWKN